MKRLCGGLVFLCASVALADCPNKTFSCDANHGNGRSVGSVEIGRCWSYFPPGCHECKGTNYAKYAAKCNDKYSAACNGTCYVCGYEPNNPTSGNIWCYDLDGKAHVKPSAL